VIVLADLQDNGAIDIGIQMILLPEKKKAHVLATNITLSNSKAVAVTIWIS
jgi:hypothetical protein